MKTDGYPLPPAPLGPGTLRDANTGAPPHTARPQAVARRSTRSASWGRLLSLVALLGLLGLMPQAAQAEDCHTMLQPFFAFATQQDSYTDYSVYATVTRQFGGGVNTNWTEDGVWYSNHEVSYYPFVLKSANPWKFVQAFSGNLPTRRNTKRCCAPTYENIFVSEPSGYSLDLTVDEDGEVSVQYRLNGKPYVLFPKTSFQGTCAHGVITGSAYGDMFMISFTTTALPWPPPVPK